MFEDVYSEPPLLEEPLAQTLSGTTFQNIIFESLNFEYIYINPLSNCWGKAGEQYFLYKMALAISDHL